MHSAGSQGLGETPLPGTPGRAALVDAISRRLSCVTLRVKLTAECHPSCRARNMVELKAKIEDFHTKLTEIGQIWLQMGVHTLIRIPDKVTSS
jgi:hypothetical protein